MLLIKLFDVNKEPINLSNIKFCKIFFLQNFYFIAESDIDNPMETLWLELIQIAFEPLPETSKFTKWLESDKRTQKSRFKILAMDHSIIIRFT